MTQHIKYTKLIPVLLVALLNINCKKEFAKNNNLLGNSIKTKQNQKGNDIIFEKSTIKNKGVKWIFNKVVPISNTYTCDSKMYESFKISILKDSIFIDGIYTDDVYRGIIKTEKYFPQKYLFKVYKTILLEKFNLKLPSSIENIRNKRVYDKKSKLDNYFQDAFFIDNFMFFEKNGCLYCFKKNETKISTPKFIKLPVSKKEMIDENYVFSPIESKIVIDGVLASGEYKTSKDISILWFDGDIEKWFIVTIVNNKIYQKLLIGKSETIELKNNKKQDNLIDFFIDKNLKIKLEFSVNNYKTINKTKEEYYTITENLKIIKN